MVKLLSLLQYVYNFKKQNNESKGGEHLSALFICHGVTSVIQELCCFLH